MSDSEIQPTDSASNVTGTTGTGLAHSLKRHRVSKIYDHTLLVKTVTEKGVTFEIRKCKHCVTKVAQWSFKNATTAAIKHMNKYHQRLYEAEDGSEASNPFRSLDKYLKTGMCMKPFSQDNLSEALVELVVMEDLPFQFVDSPFFRALIEMLRPGTKVFGRTSLLKEIYLRYDYELELLKERLKSTSSKISVTGDCWTSSNNLPFLGVTAHYIDSDWTLKNTLLAFEYVDGEHSGERLASSLISLLDQFNISSKFLMITTDNASNNKTMIEQLEKKLGAREGHYFQGSW